MRFLLPVGLLLSFAAGCNDSATQNPYGELESISAQEAAEYRKQFLAEEEPEGASTVIEVRDQLATASTLDLEVPLPKVVVVGVLGGGMPNPFKSEGTSEFPWFPKMAAFALVDPTTAEKFANTDHKHTDGEECLFCTNTAQGLVDTVATVTINDSSGTLIPERADRLLGLEKGATVVVEGRGRLELGSLKVVAERIYIRK